MNRRQLISLLVGAAAALPVAVRAQSSPAHALIGVLSPLSATAATKNIAAFRSALRDLGYVNGRNMTLELRYGDGALDRMDPLAAELVALKPNVLFAGSQPAAQAVHRATQTISVVIITPENPVVSGLVNSIARPGGNITGTWSFGDDAMVGKRLDFLKLAVPNISRVGVLINPDDPTDAIVAPRLPAVVNALGITITTFEVRDPSKLNEVSARIAGSGVQALFVGTGPTFNSRRAEVTAMVARLRVPAIYGFREFVDAGGLMSYGPSVPDMYRQSARLVDRILKGTRPGELPVELPTRYELTVNLKTAKAVGLPISDSFLLLADEVIE